MFACNKIDLKGSLIRTIVTTTDSIVKIIDRQVKFLGGGRAHGQMGIQSFAFVHLFQIASNYIRGWKVVGHDNTSLPGILFSAGVAKAHICDIAPHHGGKMTDLSAF